MAQKELTKVHDRVAITITKSNAKHSEQELKLGEVKKELREKTVLINKGE